MEEIDELSKDLKKIVVLGPECTGKTALASSLAHYYNTSWVPEFARSYIDRLDRAYNERDLLVIAKGQLAAEDKQARQAKGVLICDTDLIVIKVWQEHKFGVCYPEILEMIGTRRYDLYLLTQVDISWDSDPQRENPHLREFFFDTFRKELEARNLPYVEIKGEFYERKKTAVKAIDQLLG